MQRYDLVGDHRRHRARYGVWEYGGGLVHSLLSRFFQGVAKISFKLRVVNIFRGGDLVSRVRARSVGGRRFFFFYFLFSFVFFGGRCCFGRYCHRRMRQVCGSCFGVDSAVLENLLGNVVSHEDGRVILVLLATCYRGEIGWELNIGWGAHAWIFCEMR